jgi:hypothetical protein
LLIPDGKLDVLSRLEEEKLHHTYGIAKYPLSKMSVSVRELFQVRYLQAAMQQCVNGCRNLSMHPMDA